MVRTNKEKSQVMLHQQVNQYSTYDETRAKILMQSLNAKYSHTKMFLRKAFLSQSSHQLMLIIRDKVVENN